MDFDQYYVVILKKGPNWTGELSRKRSSVVIWPTSVS